MKINFHTIFDGSNFKVFFILMTVLFSSSLQAQADSLTTDTLAADTTYLSSDALNSPVRYQAEDSIRLDIKKQQVYLYGKSVVYYEDIVLNAEEIMINMDSNTITAKGKKDTLGKFYGEPIFTEAGKELKSHEIKYNFQTEKGIITDAITHEGENYIHGDKIYRDANDILYIKNGKYTTQFRRPALSGSQPQNILRVPTHF